MEVLVVVCSGIIFIEVFIKIRPSFLETKDVFIFFFIKLRQITSKLGTFEWLIWLTIRWLETKRAD
jgi:hypothetical protein